MTEQEWREKMVEQMAALNTRIALSEQHLESIDKKLNEPPKPCIRHVNEDGVCDAYQTVIGHDRKINQWIGFTAGVSALSAMVGGAIVALITWLRG